MNHVMHHVVISTELFTMVRLPVILGNGEDTVLLESAIRGRVTHIRNASTGGLVTCAKEMTKVGEIIQSRQTRKAYHDRKYTVYRMMHVDFLKCRSVMAGESVHAR